MMEETMAKVTRKIFTVEGSGAFPIDMLRYDACWPYTERFDTHGVDLHAMTSSREEYRKVRRVVLATDCPRAPTEGRWASFNWRVVGMGEHRQEEKENAKAS
jgi:hypothetical protein